MVGGVVVFSQPFFGHRHANAIADASTQRAGGGFDAGGFQVLGVSGTDAADLAKVLDVFQLDRQFVLDFAGLEVDCFHAR